ncbi:hypothetical protein BT93_L0529 [Corymbia citriodora subsp. variegata]|uniref:Uncharacterized protein n=1 Tax=Corymbia citriodora subsp. variegata TaxID=360336 RepID=A0A8T0D0K6_CORYI|nr:hypothetical protein BT93_L0529 [Corymbia citriodora subsp. variegata]
MKAVASSSSSLSLSHIATLHRIGACSLLSRRTFVSPMDDAPPHGGKENKADQMRECRGKEACEFSPRTEHHVSDRILPHILNLYASRATPHDFEIYADDASFEDPLMSAHGLKQIKSAFYSVAKVFSESRIVEYTVKENLISPGKYEILIDNKQYYKFLGRNIDMISLIRLHVENDKVIRHEDWWDKKPLKNRDTVKIPMVGITLETLRRGSMMATHVMMGFGKDPAV